jgi:hypothetical protein
MLLTGLTLFVLLVAASFFVTLLPAEIEPPKIDP